MDIFFTRMKETFYFSHDYNVRSDIKIKKLIAKHGYSGYGIFWGIIEDLYNNANALPLDYFCIASEYKTTENVIDSIINEIHINFGSIEYCQSLENKYGTFICPATKGGDIEYRCGLNCTYCIDKNNVCFVEH